MDSQVPVKNMYYRINDEFKGVFKGKVQYHNSREVLYHFQNVTRFDRRYVSDDYDGTVGRNRIRLILNKNDEPTDNILEYDGRDFLDISPDEITSLAKINTMNRGAKSMGRSRVRSLRSSSRRGSRRRSSRRRGSRRRGSRRRSLI